ncbi:multicopper oxidase domain-containing protein [Streptomyces sp. NPDC086549]|uniref:multicopper oxidase domain-containing protein n=1 Tax=Streptomyces sp. NPDC086549 TaxID=3365752 RepID=UPI0037FAE2F3
MSDNTEPAGSGRTVTEIIRPFVPAVTTAVTLGLLLGLIITGVFRSGVSGHTEAAGHGAQPAAAAGGTVTVDLELGDMYVKPSSITVPAGSKVVAKVVNKGAMPHNMSVQGKDVPLLDPGASTTYEWGAFDQSTQAWCTVPGHKEAGLLLNINVQGAGTADHASDHSGRSGATTAADGAAKIDPNAEPSKDWKPVDPVLPPSGPSTHEVTLHVKETEQEVAPGVRQLLWTYDGKAPGPTLHGKVGDTFKVTLVNDGSIPHSIDFHASKVAPNVQMRTIKPGEKLLYEFTAKYAGAFTYHCGAAPMIHHMGNGRFGAIIIDPPNLPKVDKEYAFVQSELYLGARGKVSDLNKMTEGKNDAVVFNGYHNQYVHAPIKVDPIWLSPNAPLVVVAGLVANIGAIALWAVSRTHGLSFGPHGGGPEEIGALDVSAGLAELITLTTLVLLVTYRPGPDR